MIFFHLDNFPRDHVAFLMCNRTLYSIGFNHVQKWLCECYPCCAGDRLICMGYYCRDENLPVGILPEDLEAATAWKEELARRPIHKMPYDVREDFKEGISPTTLSYAKYAAYSFKGIYDVKSWCIDRDWQWKESWRWREALDEVLRLDYPTELEWILCNLTKRVYVTARAIAERTGIQPRGPFFNAPINLTDILMFRICFSTDDHTSLPHEGLHQGPWAADRIEITTMDRLALLKPVKGGEEKDWEDISEEAVEEVVEIAKSEYPDEWEEVITNPIKPIQRSHIYIG